MIFIETGGIEWEIHIPARSVDDFGNLESPTKAYIWLHHYEDGMKLYGFVSEADRSVFIELMKVEGIGPKQSMKIVSGISACDLASALDRGDLQALQRIPGVGPKVAQKMMLTLKGRLVELTGSASKPGSPGDPDSLKSATQSDVVQALVDMGFARGNVEKAVRTAISSVASSGLSGASLERDIFRHALVDLSSGG